MFTCSVKHVNALCSDATLQLGGNSCSTVLQSLLCSASQRSSVNEP